MLEKVIQDCLNNAFDIGSFTKLCSELSGLEFDPTQETIPDFNTAVKSMIKVGGLSNGLLNTDVDFVVVQLQSGDVTHSRMKHRDLAKKYLKQYGKDAGVFAFVDDTEQWRLSFVQIRYARQGDKITEQVSTAKRYSYLVGKNKNIRTACTQLLALAKRKNLTASKIQDAFAVEPLNKEFYKDIENWYTKAVDTVKYSNDLGENGVEQSLIRFLTRILFCWFLREKGLIDGDIFKQDIVEKFVKLDADNSSYYKAVLQNLFFATLNQKRSERQFSQKSRTTRTVTNLYRYNTLFSDADGFIGTYFKDIPFLNGGLFECLDYESETEKTHLNNAKVIRIDVFTDNPRENSLYFPNDILLGEGGLFAIFNRYQFTIEESSPLDVNVALDPELLGRIFENLLASYNSETQQSARKGTGSFYTPRDVVQYMIRASLRQYFLNQGMDTSDIDKLYNEKRPNNAHRFKDAIKKIKVFDPACGSGAFPMGVLSELVHFLEILDPDNVEWKTAAYSRKLRLLQNGIYGVDIQPIATQITKLRFFISLLVDQIPDRTDDDNFGILPLPNLEAKFIVADSLIQLDKPEKYDDKGNIQPTFKDEKLDNLEKELLAIQKKFFFAGSLDAKRKCKIEDKQKRQQMAIELRKSGWNRENVEKIVNWDLYNQNASADWFDMEWMFGITDGFDIVIGNPPYIQLQKNGGALGEKYKAVGYKSFASTGDIYALFYERGHQILSDKGVLCYITSNKWMRAGYGKHLRQYFTQNTQPHILIDMGPGVFESATVDTNILLFSKHNNTDTMHTMDALTMPSGFYQQNESLEKFVSNNVIDTPIPKGDEQWTILSAQEQRIKSIIETKSTRLKDWGVNIYRGVLTGYNPAFIIDSLTRHTILSNCTDKDERTRTDQLIRPILRGKDIKKYQAHWADLWLIGTFPALKLKIDEYPALKQYLAGYLPKINQTGENYIDETGVTQKTRKKTGHKWFETQDSISYWSDFFKPKICWGNINYESNFSLVKEGDFINAPANLLISKKESLKYLIANMNSKVFNWYFTLLSGISLGQAFEWKKQYIESIPIPKVCNDDQEPFEHLVDYIQFCNQHDLTEMAQYFAELVDIAVFGLYFAEKMQQRECYINDGLWQFVEPLPDADANTKKQFLMDLYKDWQKQPYLNKAFTHYTTIEDIQIVLQGSSP